MSSNSMLSNLKKLPPDGDPLYARPGERWAVERDSENDWSPFQGIGVLSTSKRRSSEDIFELLETLTLGSLKAFNLIKRTRNWHTNICVYTPSSAERTVFNRNTKKLEDAGILKRIPVNNQHKKVRKGTFMINPALFRCNNYKEAKELWQKL